MWLKIITLFIVLDYGYNVDSLVDMVYTREVSLSDVMCPSQDVVFQAAARSAISCTTLCTIDTQCKSVIYHRNTSSCFGLSVYTCSGATTSFPEARFYKAFTEIVTGDYLVSGPNGVPDSQMSDSSFWSPYKSSSGRLDDPSHWSAGSSVTGEWIQVTFLSMRTISAIVTQGSCCSHGQWVKTYKVLTSSDCNTFTAIKDGNGGDQVFNGNFDDTTHVTNTLTTPVTALCVRINPTTWNGWVTMRFDLLA